MALDLAALVRTAIEIALVFFTALMAIMTGFMVRETARDRRMRLLEKRLDEFYMPLISLFSAATPKDREAWLRVEEIITNKRYLCGPKTASILPPHFNALIEPSTLDTKFHFTREEDLALWRNVANILWEESKDLIKKYYGLGGIENYKLPEQPPEWMLDIKKDL